MKMGLPAHGSPAGRPAPQAPAPGLASKSILVVDDDETVRSLLVDLLRLDGFHVLAQRTSLTPIRKFWIAWKTWITA